MAAVADAGITAVVAVVVCCRWDADGYRDNIVNNWNYAKWNTIISGCTP